MLISSTGFQTFSNSAAEFQQVLKNYHDANQKNIRLKLYQEVSLLTMVILGDFLCL